RTIWDSLGPLEMNHVVTAAPKLAGLRRAARWFALGLAMPAILSLPFAWVLSYRYLFHLWYVWPDESQIVLGTFPGELVLLWRGALDLEYRKYGRRPWD